MTTVLICLAIVAVLPYFSAVLTGYFRQKQFGKADNKEPRVQCANLEGAGARAVGAQANAWEAVAFFTATVVILFVGGVDWAKAEIPAMMYVASRIAHPVTYLMNQDILRSIVFVVGFASCIYMWTLVF